MYSVEITDLATWITYKIKLTKDDPQGKGGGGGYSGYFWKGFAAGTWIPSHFTRTSSAVVFDRILD